MMLGISVVNDARGQKGSAMSTQSTRCEFAFRKNDSIGAAAAEEDAGFLEECFIDTGDLDSLRDCQNARRIVVGRTGAGKSALLARISTSATNHVIQLSPHTLSLHYVVSSDVIRFFEEAGVNLNPYYMLMWKHIFVVEFLKAKYHIKSEDGHRQTMSRLREIMYRKDAVKAQAVDYLETWGNKFWLTTDERMKELTNKVEKSLSGSVQGAGFSVPLNIEGARHLTTEERTQIVALGKRAVNNVQIRELENIIQVLADEVFIDPFDRYYMTIDELDEEWAEDRTKYRLIKALIDTVRSFRRIVNVKVILALRYDLLDKVLHATTDPGFQEEKYEALYLFLKWNKVQLANLLERRVNLLIRRRYTTRPINLNEILPTNVDEQPAFDYLCQRTFMRPRDLILFFNECIALAEGKPKLTAAIIKQAEEEYSRKRLQSLAYEWQIFYPNLKRIANMFYGMTPSFPLSDISKEFLDERFTTVSGDLDSRSDPNVNLLNSMYEPHGNFGSIRNSLVRNLHAVGILGIKHGPTSTVDWATNFRSSLSPGEVRNSAVIYIHPMFHRALGVRH